jgi:acetyl-CoA decarbonylase/synthase complex subunit epsilon
MTITLPYHRVNVLSGTKAARIIEDPVEYAHLIKRASRPLLVIGLDTLRVNIEGKQLIEYAAEIAKAVNIPVCATANTQKRLRELSIEPASTYDIIEIINHLKDPAWKGVKKEGNHDLVLFLGIRSDLSTQGLSTLKNFARHLKTMTLCRYYFPHASYSLPNLKEAKWKEFLESMITNLKAKEA